MAGKGRRDSKSSTPGGSRKGASRKGGAGAASKRSSKPTADDDGAGVVARCVTAAAACVRLVGRGIGLAWRNVATTAFVLLVLAGALGWAFGRGALESRVAAVRGGPLEVLVDADSAPWRLSHLNEYGLYPAEFAMELTAGAASPDPFDQASLERAADMLTRSGWFKSAPTVRRLPEQRLEVSGPWRTPKALVQREGLLYLVDGEGRLMFMPERWSPSPVLLRVYGPELGPPRDRDGRVAWGQPWPGGSVQHAVRLAEYLAHADQESEPTGRGPRVLDRIVGVDVSAWSDTPEGLLRLRTDRGGLVVWGAPIGEEPGHEVPVRLKLDQLREALAMSSRWDDAGRKISVNRRSLYLDDPIGADGASGG